MPVKRIDAMPTLPKRPEDSHKGLFGSILVVGGGRGMAGAPALTGAAALRSGAGLVRVACAAEVQPTVATFEPCFMTYPLPNDSDGLISFEPRKVLEKFLATADVLAMGPGLGQSDDLRQLTRWVAESVEIPTVLDADALNALDGQPELLQRLKRPVVITPHPGEFARLTRRSTAEVQANRETFAVELAQADNLIVVLKGSKTVVTDGARVYINNTGNPGMATGGAGDVLTGVIAALIGQKLHPFEAAQLGVYIHGLAGDIAKDHDGEIGLIAGDIVDALADAFYHLSA